jgi:DNA repair protein RadC
MPRLIRELPFAEQPRYRLAATGPAALSDAELVAILANLPDLSVAQRLLDHFGNLSKLARADAREIRQHAFGVGPAKAAQLGAAAELARRLFATVEERVQIRSPADAVNMLRVLIGSEPQEHLVVVILDTKNRVIKTHTVYIGNINSSMIRMGEIYREPVRLNAMAIIVAHNHPSGDPKPSSEDISSTKQIVATGKLLDIECLDHLIITESRHTSLRELGMGFSH